MKKIILTYCIIFLTTLLSGQDVRISITPISNVFHNKYVGDTYDSPKLGFNTNLDYLFSTNKSVNFGLGLNYQSSRTINVSPTYLIEYSARSEKINILSIALKSMFKLTKEFYFSFDPTIDYQINYNKIQITDNQSGMGLSVGVGGNFKLNNFLLFNVEPRLWIHNIIPFNEIDSPFRLSTAGINLGLIFGHTDKRLDK
jgi:hypothetical protein